MNNTLALLLTQLSAGTPVPGQKEAGQNTGVQAQSLEFLSLLSGNITDLEQNPLSTVQTGINDKQTPKPLTKDALQSILTQIQASIPTEAIPSGSISIASKPLAFKTSGADQAVSLETIQNQIALIQAQVSEQISSQSIPADNGEQIPLAALILSGLTPAEITEVGKSIKQLEQKLGREVTVEDIISGVGSIIPKAQEEAALEPDTLLAPVVEPKNDLLDKIDSLPDFAAKVVALVRERFDLKSSETKPEPLGQIIRTELVQHNKQATQPLPLDVLNIPEEAEPSQDIAEALNAIIVGGENPEPDVTQSPVLPVDVVLPDETVLSALEITEETEPTAALAGALNAIAVGEANDEIIPTISTSKPAAAPIAPSNGEAPIPGLIPAASPENKARGIETGTTQPDTKAGRKSPAAENISANAQSNGTTSNNQAFQNLLTASVDPSLVSEGDTLNIHTGLPFSSTAQAAHAITQSVQQAGQPHPATQMVSAKLQQGAQLGQNQIMTINLEPAELGKIEIRLEFGKDKTIKANMLVEKSETYMMLHRDSFALERALQSSGLEIDGGSINFELAGDNSAFGQNNDGQGGGEKFGNGNSGSSDEAALDGAVTDTTMTWAVDSATGHVRYNILA